MVRPSRVRGAFRAAAVPTPWPEPVSRTPEPCGAGRVR
ncbi:hypothetical protein STTU_2263 [Streptomyces sp. Tu6071]|nr:hypothetical protein STTU_2263 [Streptomyces sp. Tu6071]